MVLLTLIVTVILIATFAHCYIHYFSRKGKLINQIPGLPILPLVGNIFDFITLPLDKWFMVAKKYNSTYYPIHRYWVFGISIVTILHADDVETVLSSTKHTHKCWAYDFLRPWLGTGLLTSSGSKWHQRRKMITPTFHFNILRDFVDIFINEAEVMIKELKAKGQEVVEDVSDLAEKYTLFVVCESAMGASMHSLSGAKEYMNAVRKVSAVMAYRVTRPWLYSNWIFSWTLKGFQHQRTLNKLHKFSQKIINDRKEYHDKSGYEKKIKSDELMPTDYPLDAPKKRMAMLDLLIEANRNGNEIDDAGIQEEVDTFIFEGYDTSGSALTFSLLLLAEHKDIQEKARQEVDEMFSNNKKFGMQELQNLNFLERCIKESLRLYPSVNIISRGLKEDLQLRNYIVPAYTSIHIQMYDIHRDPSFWPDPLKFDPDRFLPDQIKGRHPYSYVPFSAGPRNCIGQKFAMLELKTAIAFILHNFYMEPIDIANKIKMLPDLIYKGTPPVRIKFISREK